MPRSAVRDTPPLRERLATLALRIALALALLGAASTTTRADTISGPGLCDICTIEPGTAATDEDQASWLAETACRLAQRITCQDARSCWMTPILANVVASAGRMATTLPVLIACDPADDCGASSPIVWVFYAFAALTLVIDAARIFVLGTSEWTAPITRLARIMLVLIIFQASTAGLGRWLWDWTGHMEATGALIGRTTSLEIQRYTDPDATSSTRCHSLLPTSTIIDEGPALLDMSRWRNGWHTSQHLAFIVLSETTDISGILAGTAWLLVPNWKGLLGLPARMTYGLTHGDLCPVFETIRMLFAVTLFATAIALALTVAFQILESILLIGFAIGLTPLLAALSVWRPTRGAPTYAMAGVIYAILSLATLGITLEVSYRLFENALMRFATEIRHPDYPVRASSGPDLHSVLAACRLEHTIKHTTPGGDHVRLRFAITVRSVPRRAVPLPRPRSHRAARRHRHPCPIERLLRPVSGRDPGLARSPLELDHLARGDPGERQAHRHR